ncbi:Ubiquitin-conjugating enzyme E2 T, partial [Choanephora cucurbitarum]
MLSGILTNRLQRELLDLEKDPPPGVSCYPKDDNITELEAFIKGPPDSPYEKGLFRLDIRIPQNYPFDPPQIRFMTLIYHPNIDDTGRICADILKKGQGWNPALNLSTTLLLLSQLLAQPNPDDPLDAEIAKEYQLSYPTFKQKAIEYTEKYATEDTTASTHENSILPEQLPDPSDQKDKQEQEEEEEYEWSTSQKKTKLSLSRRKTAPEKSTISEKAVTLEKAVLEKTTAPKKPIALQKKAILEQPTQPPDCVDPPTRKPAKEPNSSFLSKPNQPTKKKPSSPLTTTTNHKSTFGQKEQSCTVTAERYAPTKEEEEEEASTSTSKVTPLKLIPTQQDDPHDSLEEMKKGSTKRTLSQLFDKEIIVLSDDEDDSHTSNVPVLHSLQLDRKQKRT